MNMSQMYAVNISENDVKNLQDILESLHVAAETAERKGDTEKSNRIKIMAKTIEDITTQWYICN
ncbi:MAG: hypothetical protein IJ593_11535, partial [Lachnospiraceae bacterium]|nr:hypothetical protein [Lachnospiraceae bacterium]